ncbi:hypothetical protein JYT28_01590 [Desulfobulbus sp. AH-315-M07]|nr:hypothetical protein [Desulfobulbus sp. AH-315-M07]
MARLLLFGDPMRITLSYATLMLSLGLSACGGTDDPGDEPDDGSAPTISNLAYGPATAAVGEQPTISGTLTFGDPDADASKFAVSVTTPSGASQELPPADAPGVLGLASGEMLFALILNAAEAGQYTFDIWLVDETDRESNRLSGSVDVQ